jgi:hypothetical protein
MADPAADSLLAAFLRLTDPRRRRGVRHPFPGLVAITFLGLLCRQSDFASIARWSRHHWPALRDAFGFTRTYAPHATTLSRAAAAFSVDQFRAALTGWLARLLAAGPVAAAVDGKTSKQALDADGDPIHVLNVFAHDLKVCLADWPVGDGKETEPDTLKAHLGELFAAWPSLRVLTGDALFCQRPLAKAITAAGRDYLLAVKDNQPDLHETARAAFADATPATADATAREKSAGRSSPGGSGATRRPGTTHARRWPSPACG